MIGDKQQKIMARMFINISGIFLIILGFVAPYLIQNLISSVIFFMLGFLLLMNKNERLGEFNTWFKYGKIGLLFNISFLFLLLITSNYIMSLESPLTIWLFTLAQYIANPISSITDKIIPLQMVELTDGSIATAISYNRITTTSFLNLLFYVLAGMFIGKLLHNSKKPIKDNNPYC